MTVPLRIVVAGAGLVGGRHAELVAGLSGMELAAVIDPSPAAAALSQKLESPHFERLEDVLDRGLPCDGVVIATPNDTHFVLAKAAIEAKLPCLIEKPLAADSCEAEKIAALSRTSRVPVLVGHHRRHHQRTGLLRKLIAEGVPGDVVAAQVTWMLRKPDEYFAAGDWRTKAGGGPVWINLIHEIDLLRFFLGEIQEVQALSTNRNRLLAVEDLASINLRFESGALAGVLVSDCTPSPWHFEGASAENPNIAETGQDGLRLFGSKGALGFPSLVLHHHSDQANGHWGQSMQSSQLPCGEKMNGETALRNQLLHFADVVRGVAEPLVSADDGLRNIKVAEAILLSAQNGNSVHLEDMRRM